MRITSFCYIGCRQLSLHKRLLLVYFEFIRLHVFTHQSHREFYGCASHLFHSFRCDGMNEHEANSRSAPVATCENKTLANKVCQLKSKKSIDLLLSWSNCACAVGQYYAYGDFAEVNYIVLETRVRLKQLQGPSSCYKIVMSYTVLLPLLC